MAVPGCPIIVQISGNTSGPQVSLNGPGPVHSPNSLIINHHGGRLDDIEVNVEGMIWLFSEYFFVRRICWCFWFKFWIERRLWNFVCRVDCKLQCNYCTYSGCASFPCTLNRICAFWKHQQSVHDVKHFILEIYLKIIFPFTLSNLCMNIKILEISRIVRVS